MSAADGRPGAAWEEELAGGAGDGAAGDVMLPVDSGRAAAEGGQGSAAMPLRQAARPVCSVIAALSLFTVCCTSVHSG